MYEDQSGEFCMDEFCIHLDTGNERWNVNKVAMVTKPGFVLTSLL